MPTSLMNPPPEHEKDTQENHETAELSHFPPTHWYLLVKTWRAASLGLVLGLPSSFFSLLPLSSSPLLFLESVSLIYFTQEKDIAGP